MRQSISPGLRFKVLKRDNFRCVYCGSDASVAKLHIDHKIPVSKGGTNSILNLVAACSFCNIGKHSSLLDATSAPDPESLDFLFDKLLNSEEDPADFDGRVEVPWFPDELPDYMLPRRGRRPIRFKFDWLAVAQRMPKAVDVGYLTSSEAVTISEVF